MSGTTFPVRSNRPAVIPRASGETAGTRRPITTEMPPMKVKRAVQPLPGESLEGRVVPASIGLELHGAAVTVDAAPPSAAPAVREAFRSFRQQYDAAAGRLLEPAGKPAFTSEVAPLLTELDQALEAIVADRPDASALDATITTDIEGAPGTGSLEARLTGLGAVNPTTQKVLREFIADANLVIRRSKPMVQKQITPAMSR
jgi:hypothetical protein